MRLPEKQQYGKLSLVIVALTLLSPTVAYIRAAQADTTCNGQELMPGDHHTEDLLVTGKCEVKQSGVYDWKDVHVYSTSPNLDPNFDSKCEGPALIFEEGGADGQNGANIDFRAHGILVENNGCLKAGSREAPFGQNAGVLTIHLYGQDQGAKPYDQQKGDGGVGIVCKEQAPEPCGIPTDRWNNQVGPMANQKVKLPGGVEDYFYQYSPLPYDDGTAKGYFGYKVLAASYGSTVQLFGAKGATYLSKCENDPDCKKHIVDGEVEPTYSGASWARLNKTIHSTDNEMVRKTLVLDRKVNWKPGDEIVVTTTDYVPGHSEEREIESVAVAGDHSVITLKQAVEHSHNGETYKLRGEGGKAVSKGVGPDYDEVETRAAVALLTRSIRIVSGGENFNQELPGPGQCKATEDVSQNKHPCYFGGHTIARQGVLKFQVQGVEFYQMGQGGRIGHYPVHFHRARIVPTKAGNETFVKDSSVHDSMTRCYVIHATQRVTLARNVGYGSIGHCYYLEDGVEIDNKLYSNIGILARAAVQVQDKMGNTVPQAQNPRMVPGILASSALGTNNGFPQASDYANPAVFWWTNSWNEFVGNMAAGATACGAAYWPPATAISGPSVNQKWEGYANIRPSPARTATAPLKKFEGNYASTTEWSFNVNGGTGACHGLGINGEDAFSRLDGVPNPLVPALKLINKEDYFPRTKGENPNATRCDEGENCSTVDVCGPTNPEGKADIDRCMVTTLDGYTSSFHWAEQAFSAIWFRRSFFLITNSALTDVQGGGLTFVTGGDYTKSSNPPGNIMISARNAFIGHTQTGNPYASDAGPFNPDGLECQKTQAGGLTGAYCLSKDEALSMPLLNFMIFQRFFNIYDGPAYQFQNAYLDIERTPITDCAHPEGMCSIRLGIRCEADSDCSKICSNNQAKDCTSDADCNGGTCEAKQTCKEPDAGTCNSSAFMNGPKLGIRYDPHTVKETQCYLPNAAIAWKQPNGFYYPPAFRSEKLYFKDVAIRHYVVEPLFLQETGKQQPFATDVDATRASYCTFNNGSWNGWTAIDRQTILNDDDGTLTGLFVGSEDDKMQTSSVNEDSFFNAPVETFECASDQLHVRNEKGEVVQKNGTAKTSPYENVTTVIYPGCAENLPDTAEACTDNTGVVWSADCTNGCYGVPLYRQFQTGTEEKNPNREDRKIRMMGPKIFGRINLTVNNGSYYIDTTVGAVKQQHFPLKNIFKSGQTYYVFLVYARPSIAQTYQIYVGPKFDINSVKLMAADLSTLKLKFNELANYECREAKDAMAGDPCVKKVDRDNFLTVSLNLEPFTTNYEKTRIDSCHPSSFCKLKKVDEVDDKETCTTALAADDPLHDVSEEICRDWVGRDIDCPLVEVKTDGKTKEELGCIGFSFTLKEDPTVDAPAVPDAECFPPNEKWDVMFKHDPNSGDCKDTSVGMTNFCNLGAFPNAPQAVSRGGGTPEDAIRTLISEVQTLVQEGRIKARHARGPAKQLSRALKKLEKGKSACRQLGKFVKRISKRVRKGKLAGEDAEPLVDDASQLLQGLGCSA